MLVPYPTEQEAIERTASWATHLGCGRQPEDVTRYWYGWEETDTGWAIVIPDTKERLDQLVREDQLTPAELTHLVEAYPAYQVGVVYPGGALFAYDGHLYQVIQAHTSQADWTPDTVPALYLRRTPEGVIPEWMQPTGAHDAYALGAKVTHNGQLWESTTPANVWEPGVFGWRLIDG